MLPERRAHATLPVQDLAIAREFWEGRLGFVPVEVWPTAVLYAGASGSAFAISRASARATGGNTQIAFTVPDIDAEVAELRGVGITFEAYDLPGLRTVDGIAEMGGNRVAWFRDPDGNVIGVIEFGPRPPG
jgi:catechol 2,3-dioxygenase-like lactoylglutathione lyase family enzyme